MDNPAVMRDIAGVESRERPRENEERFKTMKANHQHKPRSEATRC
jgi:hypothetical protein